MSKLKSQIGVGEFALKQGAPVVGWLYVNVTETAEYWCVIENGPVGTGLGVYSMPASGNSPKAVNFQHLGDPGYSNFGAFQDACKTKSGLQQGATLRFWEHAVTDRGTWTK